MNQVRKTVDESRTEQVHILMPQDINGSGRLFGGVLMQWIDVVAAVVARRHSGCDVTTASVENLVFHSPARMNDTIILEGKMNYTGRTSMEVCVETYVESLAGKRKLVNRALVIMVAVDRNGSPLEVPRLVTQTAEEKAEEKAAKERHDARKAAKILEMR